MTPRSTNSNRRRVSRGFTFIEVLAVVVIITVLMGAAAAPFVHAMNSYKGQYEAESAQIEAQRAVAEFTSYGRRASYADSPLPAEGTFVIRFRDADSNRITFLFTKTGDYSEGKSVGYMTLITSTASYQYDGEWIIPSTGPFQFSQAGAAIYFEVISVGAPVPFRAFVPFTTL